MTSNAPYLLDEWTETERVKLSRQNIKLMNLIVTEEHIMKVHDFFKNSKNNIMNKAQFKNVLESVAKVCLPEEDFNIFFMKMDEKRNGAVDWDEFVSLLIIELQDKEKVVSKDLWSVPMKKPPTYQASRHRHPITRIMFYPAVKQDKTPNESDGRFVTLSKDGTINFWSMSFELEKTYFSKTYKKRVHPTWVTDLACLPDVNMIVTSSTERDLRFYDTMAKRFDLRIVISSLDKAVTCLFYHMGNTTEGVSHLLTGDMGGHVRIFSFGKGLVIKGRPEVKMGGRGPFSFGAGDDVKVFTYDSLKKGALPQLLITEYLESHPGEEWVQQVAFCQILRSFISCARCSENSLVLRDVHTSAKVDYIFNVPHGVSCFTTYEEKHLIATGGSDCVVRIWNAYMPGKTICSLPGHHAAICGLEFLEEGTRVLSVDKDKCIKIWNTGEFSCTQTYSQLSSEIGGKTTLSVYFHHYLRKLIVGSLKLAFVPYGPSEEELESDGVTHSQSVTKALFNTLFKSLITVGNDSTIMVWDIWTGKCLSMITEAHTRVEYGLKVPVEITAAAFDPTSHQLLVTGARDGSIKVWNFNAGFCIRHMSIEKNCEVTSVIWLEKRILAVGWNRHVTEFADLDSTTLLLDENRRGSFGSTWPTIPRCLVREEFGSGLARKYDGKSWEVRHTEDVICAVAQPPQILATASYNGELILWRLETAQPYRRYHVANPTKMIVIDFKKVSHLDNDTSESLIMNDKSGSSSRGLRLNTPNSSDSRTLKKSVYYKAYQSTPQSSFGSKGNSRSETLASPMSKSSVAQSTKMFRLRSRPFTNQKSRNNYMAAIALPPEEASLKPLVIQCLLFLNARQCLPNVGTLLVSLENGHIQVWCTCFAPRNRGKDTPKAQTSNGKPEESSNQGFLGSFLAVHSPGDYILSMNTDSSNEYLFTGDSAGYLSVWLLKNYFAPHPVPKIIMPFYRLQFPFLIRDRLYGRAKRSVNGQPLPILLSRHKAHLRAITHVEYIREAKVIISCSSDCSVRVWTLGGRYIGMLGQPRPWPHLEHGEEVDGISFPLPHDISKVGSFTTMKVLTGASSERRDYTHGENIKKDDLAPEKDPEKRLYGRRADDIQPLGKHFRLSKRSGNVHPPPKIDQSYGYVVPVYGHIKCPKPNFLKGLTIPASIRRIQEQRELLDE